MEESIAISRTYGNDRRLGFALVILAMVKVCQGELTAAQEHGEEALRALEGLGDLWGAALARNDLGNAMLAQGDLPAAGGGPLLRESAPRSRPGAHPDA